MQAFIAIIAAIAEAIKPYIPQLIQAVKMVSAGFVGAKLEEGQRAKGVINAVRKGAEAGSDVDGLSRQQLRKRLIERGLLNVQDEPSDTERRGHCRDVEKRG